MKVSFRRVVSLLILAACIAASLVFKRFTFVAWYPTVMSGAIAIAFALSLMTKPLCLVFAEAMPPHILPDGAEKYCFRLTVVWAVVIGLNALISAITVFAPRPVWFAWNCAIAYCIIGLMFFIESRIRRHRFSVTFHTSGSTSKPKTIVKTFESLAREVAWHRTRLNDILSRKPLFLATIEPHHMYGLLWRVLLPRASQCEVDDEVITTPESLLEKMRKAENVVIVTTPSFLEHFASYASQYNVPQNALAVITSGALLTAEVSYAAKKIFGVSPIEIFGSTETGGVATRQQAVSDTWTVFDPVTVSTASDGRIVVRSPFSYQNPFVMGDGVEMAPDKRHFKLLGRLDRLVKIAEQRVSLPEMEARIPTVSPFVKEAALAVMVEQGKSPTLGAVMVLTDSGRAELRAKGKRAFAMSLRAALLPVFPRGATPRRYRFVAELPRNAQGKILSSALRSVLTSNMVEPIIENVVTDGHSWSADFWFDRDSPFFNGHFPESPVLPGVVQVGTAVASAERLLHRNITLREVRKLKFSCVIVPDEWVRFSLMQKGDSEYSFAYQKGASPCSSGILAF